jgi:hypothetical protein
MDKELSDLVDMLNATQKGYGGGKALVVLPSTGSVIDRRSATPRETSLQALLNQLQRAPDAEPKTVQRGASTAQGSSMGLGSGLALLLKLLGGQYAPTADDNP